MSGESPAAPSQPKCVFWFKVYAGIMAWIYACVVAAGGVLIFLSRAEGERALLLVGGLYIALGAVFFIAYLLAFFFKPSPFSWVYHLVLICIGFGGCPTIAAAIPLLIYWIKPETKAFYGKS